MKKYVALFILTLLPFQALWAKTYDFHKLYKQLGYPIRESQSLDLYTSKTSTAPMEINFRLRSPNSPCVWCLFSKDEDSETISDIDQIFKTVKALPSDITLFRGTGLGWNQNKPLQEGEEFVDKGFISTSLTASIANDFSFSGGDHRPAFFVMYYAADANRKAILVDADEDEAILPHGTHFRVMQRSLSSQANEPDNYLVQICAATCETKVSPDAESFWQNFSK